MRCQKLFFCCGAGISWHPGEKASFLVSSCNFSCHREVYRSVSEKLLWGYFSWSYAACQPVEPKSMPCMPHATIHNLYQLKEEKGVQREKQCTFKPYINSCFFFKSLSSVVFSPGCQEISAPQQKNNFWRICIWVANPPVMGCRPISLKKLYFWSFFFRFIS